MIVTAGIIGVEPWYTPQYLLPLLGMILGNSLTGMSLCLDKLLEDLDLRAGTIETDLALGASRWEAAREPVTDAIRRGMIPIINSLTSFLGGFAIFPMVSSVSSNNNNNKQRQGSGTSTPVAEGGGVASLGTSW